MLGWAVRLVMFVTSIITGWFVEIAVSLLLIIAFIGVGIFWPYLMTWFADWRSGRAQSVAKVDQ